MKRFLFVLLAASLAIGGMAGFAQTPPSAPAISPVPLKLPEGFAADENIAYDNYPVTLLDVLWPTAKSDGPRPGVIIFHGGGWVRGTKDTTLSSFVLPYLRQGFVVANVEYRVASQAPAPAAVEDALRAAHWFFDHADKYHVDRKRIVVTGASAGGHLALMVGMAPTSAGVGDAVPVAAIVNGYGVTDVADLLHGPHHQGFATQWIGGDSPAQNALARRLSPLTYVRKDLPPLLTVQGADDHTVPVAQNVRLTDALKAAGADAELMLVPDAKHGFSREQWVGVHERIFAFLRKHDILR